jgi:AbrB family looped-hinge helix DNA binding protein
MNRATDRDKVYFSVKGQVVIPRRLRKEYDIKEGTPAYVVATPDGILIKPVTAVTIRRLRGLLKRKPGDKPFAQWWAEYKAEEKSLEEAKLGRHRS